MLQMFFKNCVITHLYECMINVVKQIWFWKLNGYIDLINVSSCGLFLPI
jgi:hypothetical protein